MAAEQSRRWLWLAIATLSADSASKYLVEHATQETFRHALINGYVFLVHTHNPGIAFGLLADQNSPWVSALLTGVSLAVVAVLLWLLWSGHARGWRMQAGLALVLGGACGNLIDRLMRGGVTDFFEVRAGSFRWPAFNVADSAITVGAILIVFDLLFSRHEAPQP